VENKLIVFQIPDTITIRYNYNLQQREGD